MRSLLAILFLLLVNNSFCQDVPVPIGGWREHLPYNSTIDLTSGADRVFAATPYSVFSVSTDGKNVEKWSRVTGLNETGIGAISFSADNNELFIAYQNSNIDIIQENNIVNIPDIKRDNIIGDKQIYNIFSTSDAYYLSTGLGIIVIDAAKHEVKDSWFIGAAGNKIKTTGLTVSNGFFYAATVEGLKKASVSANNLADYSSWQQATSTNLSAGAIQNVVTVSGRVFLQKDDSLFVENGNTWDLFYTDSWPIVNINSSNNKLAVAQRRISGESRVVILNPDGSTYRALAQSPAISFPRKALLVDDDVWVADQFQSLSRFIGTAFESYRLNSPEGIASGELVASNGTFYATAGEVNDAWNYQYNGNGIYRLQQGEWTNFNRFGFPVLDTMLDFISIALDKSDASAWAGSYGGGLLHIKSDQTFEIFKQQFLSPAIGDPGSYRVSGLAFDTENNLWISNYGSPQPFVLRRADGTWARFSMPFSINENALAQVIIDDYNYKWIVAVKGGGIVCYDSGSDIINPGDDHWRRFLPGAGNGNLPDGEATCIAKDRSGFIWVGTTNGIAVIQCPGDVFTATSCEAILPVVQQGNFAGLLFRGEEIRSIAVDAADRKWVATRNGAYLISATGEKVIYQFTETNSPLLSSDVKKITVDGQTGEVYFATSKGICSYRGTAADAPENKNSILVFPNPVPPSFAGQIAIKNLPDNAIVKITEQDGRLVYQTRALGGQAIWDGRDYRGRRISTGIYLVLVATDTHGEKAAGKIVFIGK